MDAERLKRTGGILAIASIFALVACFFNHGDMRWPFFAVGVVLWVVGLLLQGKARALEGAPAREARDDADAEDVR